MSLREAVLEIADQIDADVKESVEVEGELTTGAALLKSVSRQIRSAVKASGGDTQSAVGTPGGIAWIPGESSTLKRQLAQQAERDREEAAHRTRVEEGVASNMALCHNGPMDLVYVPLPSDMPKGAKTQIEGAVYVLTEDGLMFSEEETVKLAAQRKAASS